MTARYLLAQRVGDQYLTMPQTAASYTEATAVISRMLDTLAAPVRIHSDGTIEHFKTVLPLVLLDLSPVPVLSAEEELCRLILDDPFLHAVYHLGRQRGRLEAEERSG